MTLGTAWTALLETSGINNVSLLLLEGRAFLVARKLCVQYEELQEAVEEPQPVMYNSRLKNWRNVDLRESKVQKRPEACPVFERRSAQQKRRSGPTKSFNRNIKCFNCGRQGHIKGDCRRKNIESRHCSISKGGKSLSMGVKGHIYQTLECDNGKRMPFILDIGSVESLMASADLREFCPETAAQPTSAEIQGVT